MYGRCRESRVSVQDGLLSAQTADSLRAAMVPKLAGLDNLAACAPDAPMVVFSSVAGALGSAGQVCSSG